MQNSITSLDKEVFIQNEELVTKIYIKNNDRQNFLPVVLEHPKSLKDNIKYCWTDDQMTSIDIVMSSNRDLLVKVTHQKLWWTYKKNSEKNGQKELLKERDSTTSIETKLPLTLTNSQSLPKISKVTSKHWNTLSTNRWTKTFSKLVTVVI